MTKKLVGEMIVFVAGISLAIAATTMQNPRDGFFAAILLLTIAIGLGLSDRSPIWEKHSIVRWGLLVAEFVVIALVVGMNSVTFDF